VTHFQRLDGSVGCHGAYFLSRAKRVLGIVFRRLAVALALACGVLPAAGAGAATFVVDSLADRIDAEPGDGVCADLIGSCTLRAAITEANASRGNDTIGFAVSGTIVLLATLPEVADASTTGTLEIDGGGRVTVSGNDAVRILSVAPGGNVALRNIRLERGRAEWGDGGAISSRAR
jgi:CSLREA domain-containing protein